MQHVPVLLSEVTELLSELPHELNWFMDGTFGRGGHTRAVLERFGQVKVVAFDQDAAAIRFGQTVFREYVDNQRIFFFHQDFSKINQCREQIEDITKAKAFDAILLDLGVSSPQLDEAERGFSFYHSGPLDMRMDQRQELSASTIVNEWGEDELVEIFKTYGEIHRPQRVVRAIVHDRKLEPFVDTTQLAGLIERIEGWTRKGHHPATRYFLALRLVVNQELERIKEVIPDLINALTDGGRLMIITFHSLEDRIVKIAFKESSNLGFRVNKKVIQAQWEEKRRNPRARSAKLRVFQREVQDEPQTSQ